LWRSVSELFAHNALIETVAWIEEKLHGDGEIHLDVHGRDFAHFIVIGHRRDGALVRLKHFDPHAGTVGEQRPMPAPRPKGTDRCRR